jgi:hypothetical protein
VHWHAIGVPEGVPLLEFEPNLEEQPSEQEVQAPKKHKKETWWTIRITCLATS